MQLRRALAGAALAACLLAPLVAEAQAEPWRVAVDTLLYTDVDNVIVVTPQAGAAYRFDEEGSEAHLSLAVDTISAASVDVVSHATEGFSEVRYEANLGMSYAIGDHIPSISYRGSVEPDYLSNGGHVGLESRLGGADSVLAAGYGFTYDIVSRSGTPRSNFSRELFSHVIDVGLTQNLSKTTLLRFVYTLTVQDGYMAKPYRYVALFDQAGIDRAAADGVRLDLESFDEYRLPYRPPEQVPELRFRHSLALRLMHFIEGIESALRLDYQAYVDDWGVVAQILEPSIEVPLGDEVRLRGAARGYYQTSANFWQRTYLVDQPGDIPMYRSADRDLSSYVTVTGGLRIEWTPAPVTLYVEANAAYTHYFEFLFRDDLFAIVSLAGFRVDI